MQCLFCHKKIGLLRTVVDRRFCCGDHRKRYNTRSARALRDSGELVGDYGEFLVASQIERKGPKSAGRFGTMSAAAIGLIIGLCLWMLPSTPVPIPGQKLRYTLSSNPITDTIRAMLPDAPKINLRQDFRMGMGDWTGGSPTSSEYEPGALRPERLRLWKPSVKLRDYQLEFQGVIERKAMGWAFRASPDAENYYGAKLTLGVAGGRAEIERFVVLNGHQLDKVRLPIPVSIQAATPYRVRVRVKGDFFSTSVNGQVVDTWRDRRIRNGGVGFFGDKGEMASVRWVSLSEPDTFFTRLLAMGLIVAPMPIATH
jgi:hypothetical protein